MTVYDSKKYTESGAQNSSIVDWGEYSNVQQAANLCQEFLARKYEWDTPCHFEHRTERGGSSAGAFNHIINYAKNNVPYVNRKPVITQGEWKKEPKWKPGNKGLVLIGGFQQSPYLKFLKKGKKHFEEWTGFSPDSEEGKRVLEPIPIIARGATIYFGCEHGRRFETLHFQQPEKLRDPDARTKENAIEVMIRYLGPSPTWNVNETKLRIFGAIDDDPYSCSANSSKGAEPRKYWTIHIFEKSIDGVLNYEERDFWEETQRLYGTNDIKAMARLNTQEIYREVYMRKE